MVVQNAPEWQRDRLSVQLALLEPDLSVLLTAPAGYLARVAQVVYQISFVDDERLHRYAESYFNRPEGRLELLATMLLHEVTFESLWDCPPELWGLHIHAALQAATLMGLPVAEYVRGGIPAVLEALRNLQQQMMEGAPSPMMPVAPGGSANVTPEYTFEWRKGQPPRMQGRPPT